MEYVKSELFLQVNSLIHRHNSWQI